MPAPAPFSLERAYAWVTYPIGDRFVPEFAGFALRILITPSWQELQTEAALYEASFDFDFDAHDRF